MEEIKYEEKRNQCATGSIATIFGSIFASTPVSAYIDVGIKWTGTSTVYYWTGNIYKDQIVGDIQADTRVYWNVKTQIQLQVLIRYLIAIWNGQQQEIQLLGNLMFRM